MKRLLLGLFALSLCSVALAGTDDLRKRAEASLVVTGSIEINPDGHVLTYTVDHPDRLTPAVLEVIRKSVPGWTFQLDVKRSVIAKASMSLRLVAKAVDDRHVSIRIAGAAFGEMDQPASDNVSFKELATAVYPRRLTGARVSGIVYVLLRIGRDGHVEDAATEQVNLTSYAPVGELDLFRETLAHAALKAANKWTFNPPTTGKEVNAPYWYARVPVEFDLLAYGERRPHEEYGQWQVYLPGPRLPIPWVEDQKLLAGPVDAAPSGVLQPLDTSLHLTTAPDGP